MENDMFCNKLDYTTHWLHFISVYNNMNKDEIFI